MIAFLPTNYDSVLEIGCGEGRFADNLTQGCDTWAIEQEFQAADIASKTINTVIKGTYNQVSSKIPDQYFDLVVCNDVIEHMEDPNGFLLSIKEKMKPNSFLIGSIPNVRFYKNLFELLIKKDWRYKEKGVLDYTHLRFFTERSIYRLFSDNGFEVKSLFGINSAKFSTSMSTTIRRTIMFDLISIVSLGLFRDIQYRQYGFQAMKSINPYP